METGNELCLNIIWGPLGSNLP